MKKSLGFAALAISALMMSVSAMASVSGLQAYGSTQHPAAVSISKNMLHPPTDITVVNASASPIYAVVPNSPVDDYLVTGATTHIYNYDPNLFWTYLVLQDAYGSTFFANNVCREAIVTVWGYYGNFTIKTDSDLCS